MFKEFLDKCNSLKSSFKFTLFINGLQTTEQNTDHFYNNILRDGHRFIADSLAPKVDIVVKINDQTMAYGTIREFDSCCGKCIFHGFRLNNHLRKEELSEDSDWEHIEVEEELCKEVWLNLLELVKAICNRALYTSISFIVSREEQTRIQKVMDSTGIRPVNSFKNRRGGRHECSEYIIEVEPTKAI